MLAGQTWDVTHTAIPEDFELVALIGQKTNSSLKYMFYVIHLRYNAKPLILLNNCLSNHPEN